jgi:hypothetical protein
LFWANPVIFGFSHKVFSEPLALFILLLSTLSAGTGTGFGWFISGILAGALMGVRLSWWPFAAVYMFFSWRKNFPIPYGFGFVLGSLAWIAPMVEIVGAQELYVTGRDFIAGHFTDWGGAIAASVSPVERLTTIFATLAKSVIGMGVVHEYAFALWALFAGLGIFISAYHSGERTEASRMFLAASFFYLLWVAIGQNVTKTRHFMPMIPAVMIALAPAIRRAQFMAALAGGGLAAGLLVAHVQRTHSEPPAIRLHHWLDENADKGTVVYCGPTERFFDKYISKTSVKSVKKADGLRREINSTWPPPVKAIACDDIPGAKWGGKPLAEFPARGGDPVDAALRIYEVEHGWR